MHRKCEKLGMQMFLWPDSNKQVLLDHATSLRYLYEAILVLKFSGEAVLYIRYFLSMLIITFVLNGGSFIHLPIC